MATGIRKTGNAYDTEWYREEVLKAERGNREHIAKYDRSFNGVMAKAAADGDEKDNKMTDITKAHQHRGPHEPAASLVQHLHDRLDRHRERHGYAKSAKENPMDSLENILKDYGPIKLCKHIVETQHAPCDEHELVAALTKAASEQFNMSGDRAFSKLYESEESVRRACQVAKSMPFVADLGPLQVGGEAARAVNDPAEAIAQLKQLGRDRWPTASEATQFERALCDPGNHKLARLAVPIPRASTSFPFPV